MSDGTTKMMSALIRGTLHYAPLIIMWKPGERTAAFCGEQFGIHQQLSFTEHWFELSKRNRPQCEACLTHLRAHPEIGADA